MSFEFKKCMIDQIEIPGLYEIQPQVFTDKRGCTFEVYSEKEFFQAGLKMKFLQDNQSSSVKGVLRGLHFQTRHPQGKLVRAVSGRVYDLALDLRKTSPAFGKYYGVILDSEKQNQLYIPEGFAHGFYVLSDTAVFSYKCTDFYDPEGEGGLMWNDPAIGIDWKALIGDTNPIISEKDKNHPAFNINENYFDINGKWIGD
jgi:dTDP-4-dehydrorhamnose 3,5-epimerase